MTTLQDEHMPEQSEQGFSADWLALRETADHAARNRTLTEKLVSWAATHPGLNITELGTGTGSNLRYLCPLLGHDQHWTLIDYDVALLAKLPEVLAAWANDNNYQVSNQQDSIRLESTEFSANITWRQADLSTSLAALDLDNTHLITGSALLDLTSAQWLDQLANLCVKHACASLFVLNYNGEIQWHEPLPQDSTLNELLNAHQLSDKGFGSALGPQAHQHFSSALHNTHKVLTEISNWDLHTDQSALQQALLDGWAPAAIEQNPALQQQIEQWSVERSNMIKQVQSSLIVGHTDVLALPID